jgi:RND family efflux transporter MFP subunit
VGVDEDLDVVRMVNTEANLKRYKRSFSVAALGVLLLAGCSGNPAPETTVKAAAPIRVPTPPAPTKPDYFETSGVLVVENQIDVLTQRDGVIADIIADTGTQVQKGQLLAKIDDRQLQSDRDAADARLKSLEADLKTWEADAKVLRSDYERDQEMSKAQLITAKQLEHSKYKMEGSSFQTEKAKEDAQNARAALRSLDLELEKTRIVAPFNGVVARRYVRAGQKVAVNDRMFWVTATNPVNVQFTLPEYFAGKIAKSQLVTVLNPASPKDEHLARVRLVSPVVDPASGTIEVQAELNDTSSALIPGTNATVRVANPK